MKKQISQIDLQGRNRQQEYFILGFLLFITLVLFYNCIRHPFFNMDDGDYLLQNQMIRDKSFKGFLNVLTHPVIGMYNPLPFVIYWLEVTIFGFQAKYFHLTNLVLHLVAVGLTFRLVRKLSDNWIVAAFTTLIFAIHPMHVSVVAWASQTKTSLYVIFYLLGLISYMNYVKMGTPVKKLGLVFVLNLLSVLSKPSAVTFAPMLFVFDYYMGRKPDRKMFLEKVPFFLLSIGFGILTLVTHSEIGDNIFEINLNYSIPDLVLIANYSVTFYLHKFLLPFNLSIMYPYPDSSEGLPLIYYLMVPVIPLIIYACIRFKPYRRLLIFGFLFFLVEISVNLRIIPSGLFGMANRYSYLAHTGIAFICASLLAEFTTGKKILNPQVRNLIWGSAGLFVITMLIITTSRIEAWSKPITHYDVLIEQNPDFLFGYNQRSNMHIESGNFTGALADLNAALSRDSMFVEGLINRAELKCQINDFAGAVEDNNRVLRIRPDNVLALNNRGKAYMALKQYQMAMKDFDRALEIEPTCNVAYYNRGLGYISLKKFDEAIPDLEMADSLGLKEAANFLKLIRPN